MIKIECIDKYYSNGKVEGYALQDEAGNVMQLTKEQVKKGIKTKQFEVTNLQIDSLGRLVNKKIVDNAQSMSEQEKWEKLFDYWYKHLPNHWVKFTTYNFEKKGIKSMYPPGFVDMFKSNEHMQDGMRIASQFESYVREKYNCLPVKVEVKSKNGLVHWVMYVMNIDGPEGAQECVTVDWYNIYGKEKEYYLNPNNYEVRGGSLDPSKQGVYKVQIIKSDIEGIKDAFDSVFIGRDGARPSIGADKKAKRDEQFEQQLCKKNTENKSVNQAKMNDFFAKFMASFVKRGTRRAVRRGLLSLFSR
ncbi:MAG: hypothetical protein J6A94_10350 [Lachnospiraceae bacterium]|nr:hypothetical protein [Lachnospiraceae bacterium]